MDPPGNYNDYSSKEAQISTTIIKRNIGEVQEQSVMISSPKKPNISREMQQKEEFPLSTKDAKLGDTIDAKLEDRHVILCDGVSNHGSVLHNANYAKEKNQADLDLYIHL